LEADLPGEAEDHSEDGQWVANYFPGPDGAKPAEVREPDGNRHRQHPPE
jgi:hypothetical protein